MDFETFLLWENHVFKATRASRFPLRAITDGRICQYPWNFLKTIEIEVNNLCWWFFIGVFCVGFNHFAVFFVDKLYTSKYYAGLLYTKTFSTSGTTFLLDRLRANVANDLGTLAKRQVGSSAERGHSCWRGQRHPHISHTYVISPILVTMYTDGMVGL